MSIKYYATEEYVDEAIAGGATSWNELEDKPFGEESGLVEILPETALDFEFVSIGTIGGRPVGDYEIEIDIPELVDGQEYIVIWNGVEHRTIAHEKNSDYYFGNLSLSYWGGDDTGEPFGLTQEVTSDGHSSVMFATSEGPYTVSILTQGTVVKQIDEKFIPDNIARISTAAVGQAIAVKAVDENGKPTEWEAVDVGIDGYATEEWVGQNYQPKGDYLTQANLQTATNNALAQAKSSGEFDGENGLPGAAGKDGVSPTVTVSKSGKVTTIKITDINGTKTATINDGADGTDGQNGSAGKDGVSATHSWNGTTLTVTSASGTSSANLKGEKGDTGINGTSVTVSNVTESTADGGSNVVTFSDGKTLTVKNGSKGSTGSAGKTPVKGTDYFTEADKAEMVADVVAEIEGIPNYWLSALQTGAEAINTALTTAGYNKSAFLFYSDAHWNFNKKKSPMLLKYLWEHTGMAKTFFGGDIVNAESSMEYLWEWRNMLKGLPNHHSVVGNHDDGQQTNNLFSEQYIYGYLLSAEETSDITRGDSGLYYYIDSPAEKTRYLCLDTAYQGATAEQQEFVKNALISTPENWHIVAVSHIWYDTIYNSDDDVQLGGVNANASIFLTMFDNYNARSGDFTDCTGKVEFCIGGHLHWDYDSTSANGIPIILVETDSTHTRKGLSCVTGTTTESSVNGIIADYTNKTITVVRVGRGNGRVIDITSGTVTPDEPDTPEEPAYTNVLDTVGFTANKRLSTSDGGERDNAGTYVTGFIPVEKGNTIYLEKVTMPETSASYYNQVGFYDANKAVIGVYAMLTSVANANAVFTNGNLSQFTMYHETAKYIRITAQLIDSTSIITVNEEIV